MRKKPWTMSTRCCRVLTFQQQQGAGQHVLSAPASEGVMAYCSKEEISTSFSFIRQYIHIQRAKYVTVVVVACISLWRGVGVNEIIHPSIHPTVLSDGVDKGFQDIPTVISQRRPSLVEKNGWSSLWGYIKIALSASARNNSLPVNSIWCCSVWRHTFTRFCHFSSLQIRVLYLHTNVDRYPRQYPLVEFSSQNF